MLAQRARKPRARKPFIGPVRPKKPSPKRPQRQRVVESKGASFTPVRNQNVSLKAISGGEQGTFRSIPVNQEYVINRYFEETDRIVNGKRIHVCRGRVPSMDVRAATLDETNALVAYATAPVTQSGTIALSPSNGNLFNPVSMESQVFTRYARYQFVKARLLYVGTLASSTQGSFILSYVADGAVVSGDFNVSQISFFEGASKFNTWSPGQIADFSPYLPNGDWYFTDANTSTDAGLRSSLQGVFCGLWQQRPQNPGIGNINGLSGTLWLEYEIMLKDIAIIYDIAASLKFKTPDNRRRAERKCIEDVPSLPNEILEPSVVVPCSLSPSQPISAKPSRAAGWLG